MSDINKWKSVKAICNCRKTITDEDIFYKVGGSIYCKKCGENKPDAIPCMFVDNTIMEIINRNRFGSLENGIYRLRVYMGKFLIREKLENADSAKIKELTDSGSYILEKRIEGFMLRFHVGNYTHRDFFDLLDYEYEELDNLINRHGERDLKLICEGEYVIGICVVPRVGTYKNSFACYEHHFVLADVGKIGSEQTDNTQKPENNHQKENNKMVSRNDMLSYFEERLIGQQTEVRKIVYLFCEYLKKAESGKNFKAPNWMLTAPSGCGKTEVYRILRDYFHDRNIDIPVLQADLSQFTESGYRGRDASELIDLIANANDHCDGTAIVFLDEADKKFVPSVGSSGIDFNAAAQANLLTIIEGSVYDKTKRGQPRRIIDTGKTMFVLMGAFQSIRSNRQKKYADRHTIGFGTVCENSAVKTESIYDNIDIDDMIEYGMIEELAGRIELVINLHRLSKNDMKKLIHEKVRLVSEDMGVAIELDDFAAEEFLDIAYTNLGVRSVINRIRKLVCEAVSKVYYDKDIEPDDITVYISSAEDAYTQQEIDYYSEMFS